MAEKSGSTCFDWHICEINDSGAKTAKPIVWTGKYPIFSEKRRKDRHVKH